METSISALGRIGDRLNRIIEGLGFNYRRCYSQSSRSFYFEIDSHETADLDRDIKIRVSDHAGRGLFADAATYSIDPESGLTVADVKAVLERIAGRKTPRRRNTGFAAVVRFADLPGGRFAFMAPAHRTKAEARAAHPGEPIYRVPASESCEYRFIAESKLVRAD